MTDSTPPRAWPSACGGLALGGGLWLRTVASPRPRSLACEARVAPCVLALLGSRRPGHHGGVESIICRRLQPKRRQEPLLGLARDAGLDLDPVLEARPAKLRPQQVVDLV